LVQKRGAQDVINGEAGENDWSVKECLVECMLLSFSGVHIVLIQGCPKWMVSQKGKKVSKWQSFITSHDGCGSAKVCPYNKFLVGGCIILSVIAPWNWYRRTCVVICGGFGDV
jgi:hypothetical protein